MTDPMIYMPRGFQDGVKIIVYNSVQDLQEKIIFYMKQENKDDRNLISQRGQEMALTHYSQQRDMERLLYGPWPTDNRNASAASIDLIH
jgi:spore maturation protein CgeB